MLCSRPFRRGVEEFGCGKCKPCRLDRKRLWTSRLMLEATQHQASFFVTLTYDKEHYPCDGCVSLRDAQLFLKNVRYRMAMLEPAMKLRYYLVAEYGDADLRPHYHAVLFGLPVGVHLRGKMRGSCSCLVCESWQKGMVFIGSVTAASVGYVVSYVLKSSKSIARLRERKLTPEFATMSRRPHGLGIGAVESLRRALVSPDGEIFSVNGDVPSSLRFEKRKYPLGRYLRGKLRERLGGNAEAYREETVVKALIEGRERREVRREHDKNLADYRVGFIKRRKHEAL